MKQSWISCISISCFATLSACSSADAPAGGAEPAAANAPIQTLTIDPVDDSDADIEILTKPRDVLRAVFDEAIRHRPTDAIFAGVRTFDGRLEDLSDAEFRCYFRRMRKLAVKISRMDPAKLTPGEQIALDIAKTQVRIARSMEKASAQKWDVGPFDTIGNLWSAAASSTVLRSRADVDALIAKYKQFPRAIGQHIQNLRSGQTAGLTASRAVIERTFPDYRNRYGLAAADGSPFAALNFAAGVSETDRQAWKADVSQVVDASVRPAMLSYANFLEKTLAPQARTSYGAGGLGQLGETYYVDQIQVHVGGSFAPEEIHDLGRARVAELEPRVRADLESLGIHEPTLAAGLAKLRQLPESAPATVEETRAHAYDFLPRVYADDWAKSVWGLANPPPMQVNVLVGDRSAFYVIGSNTMTISALSTPLWAFDNVVLHESMHYFQDLAIRSASGEVPVSPYVSTSGGSALSEGSAHYAEILALDTSIYETGNPRLTALTRLGALGGLMRRAVRLVVDSGIHAKGWTRDQVIAYMTERLDANPNSIAFEADRYASWPGQAITYRLGAEAIASEQARARAALGNRFSQSAYNRMVLNLFGGGVELLELKTDAFIASGR